MPGQVIQEMKTKFDAALDYLHQEYGKLQTGRANAALVESIHVDVYGSKTPLKGVCSISIPESNQIVLQPWDKSQLATIEKAIRDSDLGLNPQNDGNVIRLILPPMTTERRQELVKLVGRYAEDTRVSLRNARHEALDKLKKMELPEDELKGKEKEVQDVIDTYNKKVDDAAKHKEQDIMTV